MKQKGMMKKGNKTNKGITKLEHVSSDTTKVRALVIRVGVENVERVEDKAVRIKDDGRVVLVREGIDFTQVGHGEAVSSRACARQ